MPSLPKKTVKNGICYYTVGDAAKILGTTANNIRKYAGDGKLELAQFRVNGKLYITAKSLADLKYKI